MVQIQELQEKVNNLNGGEEFYALEIASRSASAHFSRQPMSIPSPRGRIGRVLACILIHGTPGI